MRTPKPFASLERQSEGRALGMKNAKIMIFETDARRAVRILTSLVQSIREIGLFASCYCQQHESVDCREHCFSGRKTT
jgi:hypothetical protein